ncbi:MAG: amidohydrolase family protein [Candidatus Thorarchaeota archaeon]|nr:amidohydrolase family protein [Candidatus Thorarchaeota archaeon]
MTDTWKYKGPIFDAHSHIGNIEDIDKLVEIGNSLGITTRIGIVHTKEGFEAAREHYPEGIVFAKYLSLGDIAQYNIQPIIDEISKLKDEGYSLAKTWFGPRWRDYYESVPGGFRLDDVRLEPIFQTLEDEDVPIITHVADPDTYYASHYQDSKKYGFKDDHLKQLENVLVRHPRVKFQIPHFGSQPEIHRLSNLSRWLDTFPNVYIDTASSRWMARELSKDTKKSRDFMMRYQDRVLFGTDVSSNETSRINYNGRVKAQRILWDTDVKNTPLPFTDPDTKDSGGTFINGLDLPLTVLRKLYWANGNRIYMT